MATTKSPSVKTEVQQAGRFGLTGLMATVVDFGLYNLLISLAGFSPVAANVIAVTVAMIFSFIVNRSFVFHSQNQHKLKQSLLFLLVTSISVYIIQTGVLYIFTSLLPYSFEFWYRLVEPLIGDLFSQQFTINNGAKAIAVGVGMVWNFLWYKRVVFKA